MGLSFFVGLDKDENPPPPPPAPTPKTPSMNEKLQAVIITLEGMNTSQVVHLIPFNSKMGVI